MQLVTQDYIRTLFAREMSKMYQKEVPKYGALLTLVEQVNQAVLQKDESLRKELSETNNLSRISEERHGAIRLGKPEELKTMAALFEVMGMYPVGYYDLSVAQMPVHSTAFRPLENVALQKNPFRVFTSLLRVELIQDKTVVALIHEVLSQRDIFTPRVRELININHKNCGLTEAEAQAFVAEALETFRWHEKAMIPYDQYQQLKAIHPLAADIVSFKGPHINHLTPRTLDIDAVQKGMHDNQIDPKAIIEGPPKRKVPILLRQTSFKALEEPVTFPDSSDGLSKGMHRARFGEIEQRGVALKPAGRDLYDALTDKVRAQITPKADGSNAEEYEAVLQDIFAAFPDDLVTLRHQDLVYLAYRPTPKGLSQAGTETTNLDELIELGYVTYSPIVYEDFLPVSAAGIFSSNLSEEALKQLDSLSDLEGFEKALGQPVNDQFAWYEKLEQDSIERTLAELQAN